jgi:UrcA family protein
MKTVAIALATLMTGCVAITANASVTARNVQQKVVSYADLDLESDADAAILFTRIRAAARWVCGLRNSNPVPLAILDRLAACVNDATARAVAEVDEPALTRQSAIRDVKALPAVVARAERTEVGVSAASGTRM